MTSPFVYGPKHLTFVVIPFLAVMLIYDSTLDFVFEPSTAFHFSLKKRSTNKDVRQPHRDKYEISKDILLMVFEC